MKRFLAALVFAAAACSRPEAATPPAAPPQQQAFEPAPGAEATVPRITPADLQKQLGSVTLIDVRQAENYMDAHIPGAMHIPLSFIEQEAVYLPRDKPIVTYCT